MRTVPSPLARPVVALAWIVPLLIVGCSSDDEPLSPQQPGPAATSSGEMVAFVSTRDGQAEIYAVHVDGTGLTRLTRNAYVDEFPAWSPDGQHLAFQSNRNGGFDIYVMNADGSNVVRRTFSGSSEHPTWSPDGETIAYSTVSDGSLNLWKVGATSGDPSLLLSNSGWDGEPDWSPDGSKLALSSDWYAYDMVRDLFLVDADGSDMVGRTGDMFDDVDYAQPAWSPDGSKLSLAIVTNTPHGMTSLGLMDQDGSNLKPLASAAPETRSSWSPDGQRIAYTSEAGDVVWMKADGSASGTIITNGRDADWHP